MKIRILTRPYDRSFTCGQVVDINEIAANGLVASGDAEVVGDDVEATYVELEAEAVFEPAPADTVVEPAEGDTGPQSESAPVEGADGKADEAASA